MTTSFSRVLNIRTALLFGALAGSAIVGNLHAESYPRIVGDAESRSIEYGPEPHNNMVGGGRVTAILNGYTSDIEHHDPEYAQQPRRGLVAVAIGGGDNRQILWVPQGTDATAIAQIGGDGSVPEHLQRNSAALAQAGASTRG